MHASRISVLGVGLLGGSIGLAAKERIKNCTLVGYGHRQSTLDAALKMGAIDEGYAELAQAVRGADLVILCTPVGLFRPLLTRLASHLEAHAVITDVGSTKRSIVSAAGELLPDPQNFVGSHPMAGSEKRGVEFARPDLYDGALCLLTPTADTSAPALSRIEAFWHTLGMRTQTLTPEDHDRRLADVSHLPHALAAALVSMQDEASIPLAGKGFQDMTRIAGGDGALWRDILMDNRDNVKESLHRLRQKLDALLELLEDQSQGENLRAWLDQTANDRHRMLELRETDLGK